MSIKTFIREKPYLIILLSIFIFSFALDMYVLTRYSLSYGMDGPFYNLKILSILQTGFPASNDPPLVYYLLTPFVALTGNPFFGIKIGMALIGSLMAFPAYLLTETFSDKLKIESKVPALLSAFLVTVNVSYFQMIGDFMQNLVGVFFLLLLIYFTVKWLENTGEWKKYGTITVALLLCSILTHIYTGMLAVMIVVFLLVFDLIFRTYKTRKLPLLDLKIFGLVAALILGGLALLFTVYPLMFTKFTTVLSFLNGSSSTLDRVVGSINLTIFLTIPFLLGVFAAIKIFYNGLKEKIKPENLTVSKKTFLSLAYLVMTLILVVLAALPSDYQERFIAMAFVPVALLVPLGLKLIEKWISNRIPSKKGFKIGVVTLIAVLFAFSSFYTAAGTFSDMGPSITSDQYNELVQIKASYIPSKINSSGIIMVDDYHTGYWVQYVLGMQVETGNLTDIKQKYPNQTIYGISMTRKGSMSSTNYQYLWNPLFPYSFPFGGVNMSWNTNSRQSQFKDNLTAPKNSSNSPPDMGNKTLPGNSSNSPPSLPDGTSHNATTQMPGALGNLAEANRGGGSLNMGNSAWISRGTLLFSQGNIKVYRLS
ncbi:glycosyltransferase family 39 protein [Methanobacterium aggregans]|uniref:glycosyltransferase family 39 protein n=1 Tax=Methanobacterium aggregans TaxID=1615586 RepID=UPI001AE93A21|nr:glycosyltransferase family 39 protein [Methanobacterium aggregans]MBP2045362.1 hypothetical protein [Methanobacterium aggregans]